MDIRIQLLTFLFSFIYGIFYYISSFCNKKIINGKKISFQIVVTTIFVLNNVLVYSIILYKINQGVFHIYFIIVLVIGYLLGTTLHKKM